MLCQADNWVLAVEELYSACEAHAVSYRRGDISHISTFADNYKKKVHELFIKIEMTLMGWGTHGQRAHVLFKLLSDEIKTKVDDASENYSKI